MMHHPLPSMVLLNLSDPDPDPDPDPHLSLSLLLHQCTNEVCGKVYSRHRATIDTKRHACGVCHQRLIFLGKFDRQGNKQRDVDEEGASGQGGGAHAYRSFVKQK